MDYVKNGYNKNRLTPTYEDILKQEQVTLKELIIYTCIDFDGIKKALERMFIELDPINRDRLISDIFIKINNEVR